MYNCTRMGTDESSQGCYFALSGDFLINQGLVILGCQLVRAGVVSAESVHDLLMSRGVLGEATTPTGA